MKFLGVVSFIYFVRGEHYSGHYPEPGKTKIALYDSTLLVSGYIDSGASTRVFTGTQIERINSNMPREVAIKCISSRDKHLQTKIQHEFRVLKALGAVANLRIPKAYYVSSQWSCGGSHMCQFVVMTKAGPDFSRIVTRNPFGLSKAAMRNRAGQFELFVASVGLCVVAELEKLHKAGAIHGDIGRYNIANDLNDSKHVMLIDFGQSKLKSELSASEFARRVARDFRRANAFVLRLIRSKMSLDYGLSSLKSFSDNPLFAIVSKITDAERDLKKVLSDFILREFGKSFEGRIMF